MKKRVDEDDSDGSFVKWFSELDKDSLAVAGGKGANLAEMYNIKIPVPPGFIVTAQAYNYFIEKAGIKEKMIELLSDMDYENTRQLDEITKKIREIMIDSEFPEEMRKEIVESYRNLSGDKDSSVYEVLNRFPENIFVAVRSSATAEDLPDASFAGQQDSFVNIKGGDNLIEAIKKCFASLYTSRATYYRHKKGFKHEDTSLAVVVQKMVDSDKSGVVFSKDPSYDNDNIIIESVFGLGEGIVSGAITPDKYLVSRDLKIVDVKISDKKIALTRDAGGKGVTINLTPEKSNSQVLKESEIKRLAELALRLEDHYGKPQDIEFAIEGSDVCIVQTRAITTIQNRMGSRPTHEIKGEIILEGLAASPGIASGKVKIVRNLDDLEKIQKGDILVTKMTNPDMVVTMQKSSGIVTDEGGLTAHASIVSREMGIPCVVGTQHATSKLEDNEIVTVDGFNGKVYRGKTAETMVKGVEHITANTRTKIKVMVDLPSFAERASKTGIRSVGLLRMEGIIAESGKHPNHFLETKKFKEYEEVIFRGVDEIAKHFDELWVRTSDIRSDEFQNLEGAPKKIEANPMLGMHGIRYSVKHPELFKAELKALHRVSEKGKQIGVLLPQVINVDEVSKTKEYLKEMGFTKAKIGVMIETPAAVQLINDFCREGIDFVSFGTNDLTQYILAIDRGNEELQHLYNEMHPAVLHQLQYVIRVTKKNNVESSICGQAGSRREMVKFLVENGINSISVNADVAKEISDYVLELEGEPRSFLQKTSEGGLQHFNQDMPVEEKKFPIHGENVELKLIEDPMQLEDMQDDEDTKAQDAEEEQKEVDLGL